MNTTEIVNIFILDETQSKFLAVLRSQKNSLYPGMWSLPGGKVENGETCLDAAQREFSEETGGQIEILSELPILDVEYTELGRKKHVRVYRGRLVTEFHNMDNAEIAATDWVTPKQFITSLKMSGFPEKQIYIIEHFLNKQFGTLITQS